MRSSSPINLRKCSRKLKAEIKKYERIEELKIRESQKNSFLLINQKVELESEKVK